jgi:hypothetical protein
LIFSSNDDPSRQQAGREQPVRAALQAGNRTHFMIAKRNIPWQHLFSLVIKAEARLRSFSKFASYGFAKWFAPEAGRCRIDIVGCVEPTVLHCAAYRPEQAGA